MKTLSFVVIELLSGDSYLATHINVDGDDLTFYCLLVDCPIRLELSSISTIRPVSYSLNT